MVARSPTRRARSLRAARFLAILATATVALSSNARADGDDSLLGVTSTPPPNADYLQYGVALAAEIVPNAGAMCNAPGAPCILGSGAGIAARVGWRSRGPWYFGGAYEVTKQDASELYRLALLQQMRGEVRYYISTGRVTEPFAAGGLGVSGYGNEWGVDTWGPTAYLAVGIEAQISRSTTVGLALAYRLTYFAHFVDSSNTSRDAGIAQIVGLEVALDVHEPLSITKPAPSSASAANGASDESSANSANRP